MRARGWLIWALLGSTALTSVVGAETLTVTNDSDGGAGSLREAILVANTNGAADVIDFDRSLTIVLESPLPIITSRIQISGRGWTQTIIDGDGRISIFEIAEGGDLVLDGVMLQNANADFEGGSAVWNRGDFLFLNSRAERSTAEYGGGVIVTSDGGESTLEKSRISNNGCGADRGDFAGTVVLFDGIVRIDECRIADNSCDLDYATAAAIVNQEGSMTIENSLFKGNRGYEGAAVKSSSGTTWIRNSTFTDNAARNGSAIYHGGGNLAVGFSTVVANQNPFGGAIFSLGGSKPVFQMNIIAGNFGKNCDGGELRSYGVNIEDADDCGFEGTSVLTDTDPMIGALEANGGPTETFSLLEGSPAIDAGNIAACDWVPGGHPAAPGFATHRDQRDFDRPIDGDADGEPLCDVGAFEDDGFAATRIFVDDFEFGSTSNWARVVGGP